MIAVGELHGVVIVPEPVALSWCVWFAGQIFSRRVKGRDGLTAFQRAYQRKSHPRAILAAWEETVIYVEAAKKNSQFTDKFNCGIFRALKTDPRS